VHRKRVLEFISERGWGQIGEAEWGELRKTFPDVSEATLRGCGLPIALPWRGVASHSLDELASCLREFSFIYQNRPDLQRYCRDQVITAKDRARWASRNPKVDEPTRGMKAEMLDWMLVWLDDPAMFPEWVQLRRNILENSAGQTR
jgi:hypothetical protein